MPLSHSRRTVLQFPPGTYLYVRNPDGSCAVAFVDFNTFANQFDVEPGDPSNGNRQRDYVLTVSSWLDESMFGPIFADASTLTHEIAETYNDPFGAADNVHDVTPSWTDPTGSICHNNLEVGDVIEFLPNQIFPITLNGMDYHNQTEALIQWFKGVTRSDAIDGAFSYPDTTVLTKPLVSLKANCAP